MKVLKGILKALLSGTIFSLVCAGVYMTGRITCGTLELGFEKGANKCIKLKRKLKSKD